MRAVRFGEAAGLDGLHLVDLPDARPAPGEVLIEVAASTVNPVDVLVVSGGAADRMPGSGPWTPGWDLAGTVVQVGEGADEALLGRRVLGFSQWFRSGRGTQASLVALPAEHVAVASATHSPIELTALGLNGLTALQALDAAHVPAGGTVVVAGASGAVGAFVSALADARGLTVIPVGRSTDRGVLKGAEADAVVNCAPVDPRILDAVRDGGTAISVTRPFEPVRGIHGQRIAVRPSSEDLRTVVDAAERGILRPQVRRVFPVARVVEAYRDFADRSSPGRVVLAF